MPNVLPHVLVLASMLAIWAALAEVRAADEVTIYRCVGAGGRITLQDRPCPKDVHQDVRQMIRPQDPPPPPPQPIVKAPPTPQAPVEIRIVHVRDPQPLYECRTANGDTYLSQTGTPQARYVPLWTFGIGSGSFMGVGGRGSLPPSRTSGPPRSGPNFFVPSIYVEDSCERLPQVEVCQRLHDRQDELGTRIFNSQPSDRVRLERERQGLIEQMRSDCGSY